MSRPRRTLLSMEGLARAIDFTLLRPEATPLDVHSLCATARERGYAAVCVHGVHVRLCAQLLAGSPVAVGAVAGFPFGASVTEVKVHEARRALEDGAREVDMVIRIGALKAGDDGVVERDVAEVVRTCHRGGALLKAIVETALLSEEEKVRACRLLERAGADFVKTSTGFASGGATVEDVRLMRGVLGPHVGVKASGGVRTVELARELIEAGAVRVGTSRAL